MVWIKIPQDSSAWTHRHYRYHPSEDMRKPWEEKGSEEMEHQNSIEIFECVLSFQHGIYIYTSSRLVESLSGRLLSCVLELTDDNDLRWYEIRNWWTCAVEPEAASSSNCRKKFPQYLFTKVLIETDYSIFFPCSVWLHVFSLSPRNPCFLSKRAEFVVSVSCSSCRFFRWEKDFVQNSSSSRPQIF